MLRLIQRNSAEIVRAMKKQGLPVWAMIRIMPYEAP
jgi:hypothetical protein